MRGFLVVLVTLAGGVASCTADLEETCLDGPCGPDVQAPINDPVLDTGDYPTDVYVVLRDNCHGCHQEPPTSGAPFSLLTVDDAEEIYFEDTLIWQRMQEVVEPGALPQMPFGQGPLPEAELNVLRNWFATCETGACERAPG